MNATKSKVSKAVRDHVAYVSIVGWSRPRTHVDTRIEAYPFVRMIEDTELRRSGNGIYELTDAGRELVKDHKAVKAFSRLSAEGWKVNRMTRNRSRWIPLVKIHDGGNRVLDGSLWIDGGTYLD